MPGQETPGSGRAASRERPALPRPEGTTNGLASPAAWARVAVARRALVETTLRRHWMLVAILLCYAATAFIIPTLMPVPVSDDWVYARSVEILVQDHRVEILDLSVATLVFQVFWGALFAIVFDMSFGVLRVSTLTLMALSGVAFYGLCRELAIDRARSALGVAAYLFNPLTFALGFSFMTDPHFAALLVIATYFYTRGLRLGEPSDRYLIAGAVVAAASFLVRQQGALIPLAVVCYLLLSRRLKPDRPGVFQFIRIVAIPATTTVCYYLWLNFIHGVPAWQENFLNAAEDSTWRQTQVLIGRLTFIEAMYVGFFVLPLAAAALPATWRLMRTMAPIGWIAFALWEAMMVTGLTMFGADGRRMPYVPHFIGPSGTGPGDLYGGRPWLATLTILDWATAFCAVGAMVIGLVLCRQIGVRASPDRAGAGLALAIVLWQVVGVLPPSFSFRNWLFRGLPAPSLDRYLLPLLPFAILLLLWALRDIQIALPLSWAVVAVFAIFSVMATRDSFVFLRANWELAEAANAAGVPNTNLDAGAAWDGYHLYEYSRDNNIPVQSPGGAWWLYVFATATDSTYVVAGTPLPDHVIIWQVEYSSWLQDDPTYLYFQRRANAPWPP